jgi:CBS-domain-containing membrane protein
MGFPDIWVAGAVAVGFTVVIMRALRVTHPPAGAVPILGFGNGIHGTSLLLVIMAGVAILVAIALVVHAIPPRRTYPLRLPNK